MHIALKISSHVPLIYYYDIIRLFSTFDTHAKENYYRLTLLAFCPPGWYSEKPAILDIPYKWRQMMGTRGVKTVSDCIGLLQENVENLKILLAKATADTKKLEKEKFAIADNLLLIGTNTSRIEAVSKVDEAKERISGHGRFLAKTITQHENLICDISNKQLPRSIVNAIENVHASIRTRESNDFYWSFDYFRTKDGVDDVRVHKQGLLSQTAWNLQLIIDTLRKLQKTH